MRRRRFMQALAALPAAPIVAQQVTPQASTSTAPPAAPPPGTTGRRGGRFGGAQATPSLQTTAADLVADPAPPAFFNAQQFAALRKLAGLLQPPLKGSPGALDCGVPEFLDFLIGVSPADRQQLYKTGLDSLNAQAKKQHGKTFADLDASQADAILKPLLVAIPWDEDLPKDPLKHFVAQAHRDFRTATVNSRVYATSATSSGRRGGRGFGGGTGLLWLPIDPVKG
ncbi:MAG: gluconate 2-dehydrogenase subunit 3 family protein [Candidatus Sulfopaludibacter sp.]|nr:gluconate 2-dehydrogenase subunit 3 family protein [Candidatus Sulfopaludibacter sp.]